MGVFDNYQPNAEDAKKVDQRPIIAPGTYQARMVKAESRNGKVGDQIDATKSKFYGELIIESDGPAKGSVVFVHLWIQNEEKDKKGQPKHDRGRSAFSVLCLERCKMHGQMPNSEADLIGFLYTVKISVLENKSTGEKSNWCDIVATPSGVKAAPRDLGTAPVAAPSTEKF
jgi:hypothetical protein